MVGELTNDWFNRVVDSDGDEYSYCLDTFGVISYSFRRSDLFVGFMCCADKWIDVLDSKLFTRGYDYNEIYRENSQGINKYIDQEYYWVYNRPIPDDDDDDE